MIRSQSAIRPDVNGHGIFVSAMIADAAENPAAVA